MNIRSMKEEIKQREHDLKKWNTFSSKDRSYSFKRIEHLKRLIKVFENNKEFGK